jgi:hypothetical protein
MPAVKANLITIIRTVTGLIFLQSCTYDKETLVIFTNCPDALNVLYAAKVQPLLQANCFSCHGKGPGISSDKKY